MYNACEVAMNELKCGTLTDFAIEITHLNSDPIEFTNAHPPDNMPAIKKERSI